MGIHQNFVMFYNLLIWQMLTVPYYSRHMAMGISESSGQPTSKCSSITFRYHCMMGPSGEVTLFLTPNVEADMTKSDCVTNQTQVYKCENQVKSVSLSVEIGSRTISQCLADRRNVCTSTITDRKITGHQAENLKFVCTIETDNQIINVSSWVCSEVTGNTSESTSIPNATATTTTSDNFPPNNKTSVKGNNSANIAEIPYMWIIIGTLITLLIIVLSVAVYCYKKNRQQMRKITNEIRMMTYNINESRSSSEDHTYVNRDGQGHQTTPTQANISQISRYRQNHVTDRSDENEPDYLTPINADTSAAKPMTKQQKAQIVKPTAAINHTYERIE